MLQRISFHEGGVDGTGTPSHASNPYIWNNVFDTSGADGVNHQRVGWHLPTHSGDTQIANKYLIGLGATDQAVRYNAGGCGTRAYTTMSNLLFENNISFQCSLGPNLGALSGTSTVAYNFYGAACIGTNNCFVFDKASVGSFDAWRTTTGFDTDSVVAPSDSLALLNADRSPQSGSPVVDAGINLTSLAPDDLATLSSDTTNGWTADPHHSTGRQFAVDHRGILSGGSGRDCALRGSGRQPCWPGTSQLSSRSPWLENRQHVCNRSCEVSYRK